MVGYNKAMHADTRLRTLQSKLGQYYVISDPFHIQYIAGFIGAAPNAHESFLVINPNNASLVVPQMYTERAKALPLVAQGSIRLVVDDKKEGLFQALTRHMQESESDHIMIDEKDLHVSELRKLEASSIVCKNSGLIIEHMRAIKDEGEIELLKKADDLTKQTLQQFEAWIRSVESTTVTELECVEKLRSIALQLGADGLSFDPIVASGAASSQPHYIPTHAKIQQNTVLLVDVGVKVGGYCGDRTATFALGNVHNDVEHIIRVVEEAHNTCVALVADGVTGKMLYDALWKVYTNYGLPAEMPHSLGHGLGLEIHEPPFLRPLEDQVLQKGMVITIEPGFYVEGKIGVRVESGVVVK